MDKKLKELYDEKEQLLRRCYFCMNCNCYECQMTKNQKIMDDKIHDAEVEFRRKKKKQKSRK